MSVPQERPRGKEKQQNAEALAPKCCPKCGGENLMYAVEWFAHSLDPCDLHNTGELSEYQCHDCAISFWM